MSKTSETILEINLRALAHNYNYFKSKLDAKTKVMAVVKAFGYGSNASIIARELTDLGVDYFAVAYASEGKALRDAGVETPIMVLHPLPGNFNLILDSCLEPSLYSEKILNEFVAFSEEKKQKNYPIHLKFNTGLNRLGFAPNGVDDIVKVVENSTSVKVRSVFSHLAASEDLSEKDFTKKQLEQFEGVSIELTQKMGYRPMLHALNTSGLINYPKAQLDMVRIGIGLYGFGNDAEENKHLRPVCTLKTVISQIHHVAEGETVGYNMAYKALRNSRTATLPLGHADGISRAFGNGTGWVVIHQQKAPIIGNVCMDMIMVDVTNIDCKEGDEVIVFGENPTAEELSAAINSIPYELLTAISQRVKRVIERK